MKKVIFLLSLMMLIYACGYQEGMIQKSERSYLSFSGNIENVSVHIDNIEPFTIPQNKQYQLQPGKHSLKVYRDGNLIVNRIIVLENQTTMEVTIP